MPRFVEVDSHVAGQEATNHVSEAQQEVCVQREAEPEDAAVRRRSPPRVVSSELSPSEPERSRVQSVGSVAA
jgi:hypothetical protein